MRTTSSVVAVAECLSALEDHPDVWRATKYISEKQTVKVTRRRFHSKVRSKGEYIVTVGRPNYIERAFLKACKKSGDRVPIRRVQLKLLPKRKKS